MWEKEVKHTTTTKTTTSITAIPIIIRMMAHTGNAADAIHVQWQEVSFFIRKEFLLVLTLGMIIFYLKDAYMSTHINLVLHVLYSYLYYTHIVFLLFTISLNVIARFSFIFLQVDIIQTVMLLGSTMRSPLDGVALTACISTVWNVLASVAPDWTAARNVVIILPELCKFRNNYLNTRSLTAQKQLFSFYILTTWQSIGEGSG